MFGEDDIELNMSQIMKKYAQMNPHISLSDIAFLMDEPYEPEPGEYDWITDCENIEPIIIDS